MLVPKLWRKDTWPVPWLWAVPSSGSWGRVRERKDVVNDCLPSGLTGDRDGLWAGWNWRRAPIASDVRRMYEEDRSSGVSSHSLGCLRRSHDPRTFWTAHGGWSGKYVSRLAARMKTRGP